MAIMELAYYGSLDDQIFLFGTLEDLKHLIDITHGHRVSILLYVVHSHASKNADDGLNIWDVTDSYFHFSSQGTHSLWDSRFFNYTSWEVLCFFLTNLRMWLNVYGFDRFRFDCVTSILYHRRRLGQGFSGGYHDNFGLNTDTDALVYLVLANQLIHQVVPDASPVVEDVSGILGLCLSVSLTVQMLTTTVKSQCKFCRYVGHCYGLRHQWSRDIGGDSDRGEEVHPEEGAAFH